MQFRIDNGIEIELTFNSEPTTPTVLDLLEYIEHVQIGLPTCLIKLNCRDNDLSFVQNSLYDGAKVRVNIKHETINFPYNLKLSIFGTPVITPSTLTNEGYDITIQCILDFYKYAIALPKAAYSGSVSSVLNQLASECGLQPKLLNTGSDNQVWFSHGRTYSQFAKHLLDHCYLSSVALPVLGVSHSNFLILKDVTETLKKEPKHLFSYQTKVDYASNEKTKDTKTEEINSYLCVSYKAQNVAGLYNALASYGSSYSQLGIRQQNNYESPSVTFSRKLANSEINKVLKTQVREIASHILPINTGNTYVNYYKAYSKNIRLRNLYSNLVTIMTVNEYTKVRLLDCVKLSIDVKFESSKDEVYGGNYLVVGKTLNITRNLFREKLHLLNYGRNMNNKDLL